MSAAILFKTLTKWLEIGMQLLELNCKAAHFEFIVLVMSPIHIQSDKALNLNANCLLYLRYLLFNFFSKSSAAA